ncbi:hypothetical protein HanRHA438_Chr12g0550871 [Helianthus annuus]|nr:hypothetical protein HanIR_Chr12g0581651 [Helianthus annuus]KAJ0866365.1 hypothetical protein HanRHA438_Chr12g0550871 [Helianthus annuus]
MQAGEHFISNDDLDKDDKVVGIVEVLRPDEDVDHVVMSKGGNVSYSINVQSVEGVEVDFEDLRGVAYSDTPVEANSNPQRIPEEVRALYGLEHLHQILLRRSVLDAYRESTQGKSETGIGMSRIIWF